MKSILRSALVAVLLCVLASPAMLSPASAKEPVEQFLEKLREHEFFDAAEWYLESLKTNPNIDAETKQILPYEQARIIVEISKSERVTAERLKKLDAAKLLFTEFLKNNASHSYVGLARVQLGNLLIERAKAFVAQAEREKKPDEKKKILAAADAEFKAARKELEQAVKDFQAAVDKFPKFVPKEQADVRKKKNDARRDLIEATMYLGNCIYQHSQAFEKDSKERKQYLTEAAAAFHKIYNDFRQVFAGMYAGIWEARCFQEQGELSRALGLYMEMMSVESNDENIHGLRIKALRMAMEAWNDAKQAQYKESIDRGEAFIKAAHGEEEDSGDGLAIKFLTAQAMDLRLDEDKKTNPKEKADPTKKIEKLNDVVKARYVSTIKKLTRDVMSSRSDYRKQAQEIFAKYGKLDLNAMPKDFADAFEQAKGEFARWQQLVDVAGDAAKPQEERAKATAEAKTAADNAIRLLRISLEFKERDKTVNIEEVHGIRYYLTFLYYSLNRYQEAALQGEFLARNYPQFKFSDHAGFIALAAWIYIYNDAPAVGGKKVFETENLVRVAELLTARWPDSLYADNAWLMLADIRNREQDFEGAAKFLENIKEKSERRSEADLKQGKALWSQYLNKLRLPTPPPAAELKALLAKAEQLVKKGIDARRKAITEAAAVNFDLLTGELTLAQIQVTHGSAEQAKAAIETLSKKDGFLTLFKAGQKDAMIAPLPLEAHKVLLRAYVITRQIDDAKKILQDLDKLFVGEGAAAARANFYAGLGQEISQQLKSAPPAEAEKLETAFHEFTMTLAAKPEALDDNMLIWAAGSNLGIGEAALKRGASARPRVKELSGSAADLYKLLLQRKKTAKEAADSKLAMLRSTMAGEKEITEGQAIVTKAHNDVIAVTIRLTRALRFAQSYKEAFDLLSPVLQENDNIFDAQVEMCDVFLDWGADTDTKKFAVARVGVQQGRKQPIWGLGNICKKLQPFVKDPNDPKETEEAKQRREDYRKKFFEAYLAYSKSYLTHAEKPDAANQKSKLLEVGVNRIQTLWNLYSEEMERSKEWSDSFDGLLKSLQQAQGKEASGLKGLPKPTGPKKSAETAANAAAAAK